MESLLDLKTKLCSSCVYDFKAVFIARSSTFNIFIKMNKYISWGTRLKKMFMNSSYKISCRLPYVTGITSSPDKMIDDKRFQIIWNSWFNRKKITYFGRWITDFNFSIFTKLITNFIYLLSYFSGIFSYIWKFKIWYFLRICFCNIFFILISFI